MHLGFGIIFCFLFNLLRSANGAVSKHIPELKDFVFWPNGVVPFYIEPNQFDDEQKSKILSALAMFTFNTCIKFVPAHTRPEGNAHVMLFRNPDGVHKCIVPHIGSSVDDPHSVTIGYDCLYSPKIEMVLMKNLGFPFEHNRASRDLFIDVQLENIEGKALSLFTKDPNLPMELRNLPYDMDSVMHFDEREFSKNGHKTILLKRQLQRFNKIGLSPTDIRKIDIVYGSECRNRDRQEKKELCQSYPGIARKKRHINEDTLVEGLQFLNEIEGSTCREVLIEGNAKVVCDKIRKKRDVDATRSLRINPNITPPPNDTAYDRITENLRELGIEDEVQRVVDEVFKVSSVALETARTKYCNGSAVRSNRDVKTENTNTPGVAGIVELVADHVNKVVESALANLTQFCESPKPVEAYQRAACPWFDRDSRCGHRNYKSTISGGMRFSTQHRPIIKQSTKNKGNPYNHKQYHLRSNGSLDDVTPVEGTTESIKNRKRRGLESTENQSRAEEKISKRSHSKKKSPKESSSEVDEEFKRGQEAVINWEDHESDSSSDDHTSSENSEESDKKRERTNIGNNAHIRDDIENEDESATSEKSYEDFQTPPVGSKNNTEDGEKEFDTSSSGERLPSPVPKRTSSLPKTVQLSKQNEEFFSLRRWPEMVVPYAIKENNMYDTEDLRRRLGEVNQILKRETCVQIKEIEDGAEGYKDFLVIDVSPDYVTGKVGGRQIFGNTELFHGGQHRQHAAMMVMAMLGFYFEVARHDRDDHIRVHMRHVRPDKLHHFEKLREDGTLPLPYDYDSATHPAWQFWRKIGKTGISTVATFKEKDPDGSTMKRLGQNKDLLSKIDIIKINSVYGIKCFQKNIIKTDKNMKAKDKPSAAPDKYLSIY